MFGSCASHRYLISVLKCFHNCRGVFHSRKAKRQRSLRTISICFDFMIFYARCYAYERTVYCTVCTDTALIYLIREAMMHCEDTVFTSSCTLADYIFRNNMQTDRCTHTQTFAKEFRSCEFWFPVSLKQSSKKK